MDEKMKVTDKRMFDSRGDLREEYRQSDAPADAARFSAEGESEETPASASPQDQAEPADRAAAPAVPEPGFMDLIGLLAQPIAMFLGDAPLPDGDSAENLALARYHIDLLELVHTKTKGNLSSREKKLLEDLLYQLRMRYVEKAG